MEENSAFTRADAENFVRSWNLYFNRSVAYSLDHPAVQEVLPRVHLALQKLLSATGTVSVLFQELGYYVGHVDLGYQPNNRKIADHLRRFGIESITFSTPLSTADLSRILEATALTHADPRSFLSFLASHGVQQLTVNDVTLQTVKEGETVVRGDGTGGGSVAEPSGAKLKSAFEDVALRVVLGHITAQEMSTNLSVLQMLRAPGESLPQAMAQVSASVPPESQEQALQQALMNTLGSLAGSARLENASVEEILAGMYSMRGELLKALKAQTGLAQHLKEEDRLPDAAESLFENTAAELIVQEYHKHKGNLRKVAEVVQRIVPEKRHLQGVLAKVRQSLMQSGVSLVEYYNLLGEINVRLAADQGYQDFLQAGTAIGVSPQELMQELQQDPRQAARLVVLSGELHRRGKGAGIDDLVQSLADLMEGAGEEIVSRAEASPRDAGRLAGMLYRLESEVGRELDTQAMPEEAKAAARQRLQLRLQQSLGEVKRRAALAQLRTQGVTETERVEFFLQTFADEKELDEALQMLGGAIAQDAVAQQVANQTLQKVREEMQARRTRNLSKELPPGVYVKAVLDFFLKFEVSRSLRYQLPFSALLVSFQGLPEAKDTQDRHGDALRGLQNVLVGDMRKLLRDSDFVGYVSFNRFLIVTPMTASDAATIIVKKLRERLSRQVALPDGTRAWIRPRCGIATFDKDRVNSYQKLYQELNRNWQADG